MFTPVILVPQYKTQLYNKAGLEVFHIPSKVSWPALSISRRTAHTVTFKLSFHWIVWTMLSTLKIYFIVQVKTKKPQTLFTYWSKKVTQWLLRWKSTNKRQLGINWTEAAIMIPKEKFRNTSKKFNSTTSQHATQPIIFLSHLNWFHDW